VSKATCSPQIAVRIHAPLKALVPVTISFPIPSRIYPFPVMMRALEEGTNETRVLLFGGDPDESFIVDRGDNASPFRRRRPAVPGGRRNSRHIRPTYSKRPVPVPMTEIDAIVLKLFGPIYRRAEAALGGTILTASKGIRD